MPKGVAKFRQAVVEKLESEKAKRTALSQEMFWKLVEEVAALEKQLAYYQETRDTLATTHPEGQRLMTIPGMGPLTATALVAAVSDASAFKNGRQCAAWLGLGPRPQSTGGKERLLGISQRGDSSLRKLLVHGARTTIRWVGRKTDRRSQWLRQLVERRGKNRTAVAVANQHARIVWALLTSHQAYELAKGSNRRMSGGAPVPLGAKGGSITATMDVKHNNRYFTCQVHEEDFPHNARCKRGDDTIGPTGFLRTCVGTGPMRPRS
jgi:transposase